MIVRNPTWNSLTPPLPKFVSCDTVETNFLKEKLGEDGRVFIVQFDLKSTSAFLFQRKSDQKNFLLRKYPLNIKGSISRANTWLNLSLAQII